MKSKSLFVKGYKELEFGEIDLKDQISADEVLVRTKACGVCAWDASLFQGVNIPKDFPFPLGHEGVGVVEEVGDLVTEFKPGDKVFSARSGSDQFSEYFINKASGLCKLPDDLKDWAMVIYEPVTCVVNLLNITNIRMGDHVVLVGAGYMGLLTLMALSRSSQAGKITVFELREDRMNMAKEYVDTVYNPESPEGKKVIEEIIAEGGADVVIEFGASTSGYELADSLTRKAGKFVIGSFHRGEMKFYGPKWHLGGLTVYNLAPDSNNHYDDIIPRTYEMIKRNIFDIERLISHRASFDNLEEVQEIFDRAVDKQDDYLKGVVLF